MFEAVKKWLGQPIRHIQFMYVWCRIGFGKIIIAMIVAHLYNKIKLPQPQQIHLYLDVCFSFMKKTKLKFHGDGFDLLKK